jgi:hypothetical protein
MVAMLRGLLILTGLAILLWPAWALGQSAPPSSLPPADTAGDKGAEPIPTPPRVLESPPANAPPVSPLVPPPPPVAEVPAADGPLRENGVLGPPGQAVGWYASVDAALIVPHIDSHLNSGSNIKTPFLTPSTATGTVQTPVPPGTPGSEFNPFGVPVTLPIAPMDWVGSPRLRLGYRLPEGAGTLQMEWRMVASQGSDTIPDFDPSGAGVLRSRVNVQYTSFTYGASEFITNAPHIDRMYSVRFGVAAADVFFDSQARGQQILEQRASNSFAGIGPTVAFQFYKPLAASHFSLYGELDATGLAGFTRQHFSETAIVDGQVFSDTEALRRQSNGVGIFGVEGGFGYAPWDDRTWRFTFGYQWQRWWWVGATSDSNAALTLQGLFLRGEWRY